MSDTSSNKFVGYGTNAERIAFTPSPATIAAAPHQLYLWFATDTAILWGYDTTWHQISSSGVLPASVQGDTIYASAVNTYIVLSKNTSATRYLSNTGTTNNPAWAQINLPDGVTGVLPGANGGGLVRLNQIVTSGSQATVDFTSISGSYQSLRVVSQSRDTVTGTAEEAIYCKVNNDGTSGNYTAATRIGTVGTTATATQQAATTQGAFVGFHPENGNTAGLAGSMELIINNYAATVFDKTLLSNSHCQAATARIFVSGAMWLSTAAITRLTFSTSGTAFKDGSTFTLYGMN